MIRWGNCRGVLCWVWVYSGDMGEVISAGGMFGRRADEHNKATANEEVAQKWRKSAHGERAENLIFAEGLSHIRSREQALHDEISVLIGATHPAGLWYKGGGAGNTLDTNTCPALAEFLQNGEQVHDTAVWLDAMNTWLRQTFGLAVQIEYVAGSTDATTNDTSSGADELPRTVEEIRFVFAKH